MTLGHRLHGSSRIKLKDLTVRSVKIHAVRGNNSYCRFFNNSSSVCCARCACSSSCFATLLLHRPTLAQRINIRAPVNFSGCGNRQRITMPRPGTNWAASFAMGNAAFRKIPTKPRYGFAKPRANKMSPRKMAWSRCSGKAQSRARKQTGESPTWLQNLRSR